MSVQILLQMTAENAETTRPAVVGIGCGITPFLFMAAAVWVVAKWPKHAGGRFIVGGLLLTLPFLGLILRVVAGESFTVEMIGASTGHVFWVVLFIYSVIQIRRAELEVPPIATPVRRRAAPVEESVLLADLGLEGGPPPEQSADGARPATPVVARCKKCMGRWRTTLAEAEALAACPKCGDSPPDLITKPAG